MAVDDGGAAGGPVAMCVQTMQTYFTYGHVVC
jgi:hypothetical protein